MNTIKLSVHRIKKREQTIMINSIMDMIKVKETTILTHINLILRTLILIINLMMQITDMINMLKIDFNTLMLIPQISNLSVMNMITIMMIILNSIEEILIESMNFSKKVMILMENMINKELMKDFILWIILLKKRNIFQIYLKTDIVLNGIQRDLKTLILILIILLQV